MAELHLGDCLEVMASLPAGSVDAVVTDPPYGLEFMGKEWDRLDGGLPQESVWKGRRGRGGASVERDPTTAGGRHAATFGGKQQGFKRCRKCGKRAFSGSPCECAEPDFVTEYAQRAPSASIRMQRWHEQWAIEAWRVLRPSHYLLAFGGTRTWHRLACALEDAGFEIRDTLMWMYGSGFPKGKACLKPAWEPVILARKPGPMRELSVDECRLDWASESDKAAAAAAAIGFGDSMRRGTCSEPTSFPTDYGAEKKDAYVAGLATQTGRWPANVVLDEEAAAMVDGQTDRLAEAWSAPSTGSGRLAHRTHGTGIGEPAGVSPFTYGDSGGASRFFYCAKASRAERNEGFDGCEIVTVEWRSWDGEDRRARLRVDTEPSPPRVIAGCGIQPSDAIAWSMFLFGNGTSDQSLTACKFTIETKTSSTTSSRTLSWLMRSLTSAHTVDASSETASGGSPAGSAGTCIPSLTITSAATVSPPGAAPVASPTRLRISGGVAAPSDHPTVKPVDLMRWLVRLVTRPGDTVLDPFTGSGTTGVACAKEGRQFIGIERESEYMEIARRRIEAAEAQLMLPV